MTGELPLYATLVLVAVGHLAAGWWVARRTRGFSGADAVGDRAGRASAAADGSTVEEPPGDLPSSVDSDADLVACDHCGTVNERGYWRCRNCVGTLPGADARVRTTTPAGGGILR